MKHPVLLIGGIALVIVGLIGVAWLQLERSPARGVDDRGLRTPRQDGRPFDRYEQEGSRLDEVDLGERIYRYGVGEDGDPVPRTAAGPGMMGGGCSACHGENGRGGRIRMMMFAFEAPDIRLDTLLEHEGGERWTRSDVARAITEGVEPDGTRLDEFMPRWELSDSEVSAVVGYLEELSGR